MRNQLVSFFFILFLLISCNNDEKFSPGEEPEPIQKSELAGFVEKGPFINGSSVSIWELDASFSQTGKSFSATTNNEGFFEITNSMEFASNYVKLSVNGFYFNEVTGEQSSSPIILEAIANIKDRNNINANLITHLEYKRVLYLISKENKKFTEAKKQAEKELLACFLIVNKDITPEIASITDNNMQANILVAVSSILLKSVEGEVAKDAKFTELINNFRDDLEKDGRISEDLKEIIKDASYRLDYMSVKENIKSRYLELGKNVTIGNFHYFIDGDGDGVLSEEDYEFELPASEADSYFKTEEDYRKALADVLLNVSDITKQVYLFDALITHSVNGDMVSFPLDAIYNYQIRAENIWVGKLYADYYKAIRLVNLIIENGGMKEKYLKYKYAGVVYRAYYYLTMVELWGDMPLILKQPEFNEVYDISRTKKEEILDFLVSDLLEAEKYLQEEADGVICTKYLAWALLMRCYLMQADFAGVSSYGSRIIQSNKYQLCPDYTDIFKSSNKEILLSFPVDDENNLPFNQLIQKGPEMPVIRYAEILLLTAEANMRENNTYEAIQLINQVRARNNRSLLNEDASENDVQVALLEEWKTDLLKEGVWFFALKRFGLAEHTLQMPGYMTLLPIPEHEILVSRNMTQNPGY